MVLTDFGNEDFGYAMTLQRDGKIILTGAAINLNSFTYDMGIARYLWRYSVPATRNWIASQQPPHKETPPARA